MHLTTLISVITGMLLFPYLLLQHQQAHRVLCDHLTILPLASTPRVVLSVDLFSAMMNLEDPSEIYQLQEHQVVKVT